MYLAYRVALVGTLLWGAVPFLSPQTAAASQNADYRHRYAQVWSASVRLIRVDYGLQLREQDADIGYLLFDWRDSTGRSHPGSMELVEAQENQRSVVRVVVRISAMPSYIEQMILDRLQRKLKEEFGDPPASEPQRRRQDDASEDEGRDRDEEQDGDREPESDESSSARDQQNRDRSAGRGSDRRRQARGRRRS